ncbi:MAG TPA: hypothetical protein VFT39_11860 [Vicinamibacterales bacterium]|nr:hypothetical protein [Vicinamibacterales bacterium]
MPGWQDRCCESDADANQRRTEAIEDHAPQHVKSVRAQCHANSNLFDPLTSGIGDHAVWSDGREYEREAGERREQEHVESLRRQRLGNEFLHGPDVNQRRGWRDLVDGIAHRSRDSTASATRVSDVECENELRTAQSFDWCLSQRTRMLGGRSLR